MQQIPLISLAAETLVLRAADQHYLCSPSQCKISLRVAAWPQLSPVQRGQRRLSLIPSTSHILYHLTASNPSLISRGFLIHIIPSLNLSVQPQIVPVTLRSNRSKRQIWCYNRGTHHDMIITLKGIVPT